MHTIEAHSERFENAMTINEFICVILLDIENETPATYPWKTGVRRSATHSKKVHKLTFKLNLTKMFR